MYPLSRLTSINGTLYGTTMGGGLYEYGTVFSLDPETGAETVLHSFSCDADGADPWMGADLISIKGKLYGTTFSGGTHSTGTVFSITP
jgi:uncharacterized repeat protein (TIGR03803 family)